MRPIYSNIGERARCHPSYRPDEHMLPPHLKYRFALTLLLLAAALLAPPARAEEEARKLPRFVSLAKEEIFVRTGPSLQYPIRWVYQKRGLPVEVIREYDTWRQVRDQDGSIGWVHHAMLSALRSAVVRMPEGVTVTASENATAAPVVRLDPGVIVGLKSCVPAWCRVQISGFTGWVPRTALWGIYPDEQID